MGGRERRDRSKEVITRVFNSVMVEEGDRSPPPIFPSSEYFLKKHGGTNRFVLLA